MPRDVLTREDTHSQHGLWARNTYHGSDIQGIELIDKTATQKMIDQIKYYTNVTFPEVGYCTVVIRGYILIFKKYSEYNLLSKWQEIACIWRRECK